ncbi:MAG: hypothetical protein V2A77_04440 [Pseudomonadota bacterium]
MLTATRGVYNRRGVGGHFPPETARRPVQGFPPITACPDTYKPISSIEESLKRLNERYQFTDYAAVTSFLSKHRFLVSLLIEAHEEIVNRFDRNTAVKLDIVTYPGENAEDDLFVKIQTDLPVDDALSRLDQLDYEWWLQELPDAQGKMVIDLEPILK